MNKERETLTGLRGLAALVVMLYHFSILNIRYMSTDGVKFRARYARIASPNRAFARVIGPWLIIVPGIIVLRASGMGALASEFFKSELFVWFSGALLLFGGLLIIAFHQYWSNVAAVLISLFGWILALRGLVLMAAPDLYERAAMSMDAIPLVRLIFGVLVAIGLYLTYVGWLAKPASALVKNNP